MEDVYVIVCWPDIQDYMDLDGFDKNAYLINDSKGLDDFGSSAYFINKAWKDKVEEQREINLKLSLVEARALYACGNIGQDIALSVFTKEELGCNSSKFIKYKNNTVYPIGTKLIINGKKCIVKESTKHICENCIFRNNEMCKNAICFAYKRQDEKHVYFEEIK